MLLASISN